MNSIFHFKQKTGLTQQATNRSVLKRRRRRELYLTKTTAPGEQAQRGLSRFPNRKSQVLFLFEPSLNSLHGLCAAADFLGLQDSYDDGAKWCLP